MSTPMLNGVLSALGASAPALAAVASPSPARDSLPGTFARQLQQAQMPAAAPPRAVPPNPSTAPPPAPSSPPAPHAPEASDANAAASAAPPRPAHPGTQQHPDSATTATTATSSTPAKDAADAGETAEATERAEQTAHASSSTAPDTAATRRLAFLRAARDRSAGVDDLKRRAAVDAEAPTGGDPTAAGAQRDGLRRLRGAGTDAAEPAPTALGLADPTRPDSAAITGLPTAPVDPLAQAAADGMGEPADAAGAAGTTTSATSTNRTENAVRTPGDGLVNPQVAGLRANPEAAADEAASDTAPGRGGKARDARMAAAGAASDAPGVDPRQLAAIPSKGGADGVGPSFQDAMAAATGRAAASTGADTQAPASSPMAGLPGFAAELVRSGQALTPGGPVGSARELTLSMPVTAAEFVPRLTGDLAVLARDGVQEARVNVHPVELGPISVQITLDGAAAQVHLAADSAQTRDLLEQAMPALAAALRDNGLTLTGGGVFQQARQQPREPSADGGSGRTGTATAEAGIVDSAGAGESTRRLRPVGALDVYA